MELQLLKQKQSVYLLLVLVLHNKTKEFSKDPISILHFFQEKKHTSCAECYAHK